MSGGWGAGAVPLVFVAGWRGTAGRDAAFPQASPAQGRAGLRHVESFPLHPPEVGGEAQSRFGDVL